MGAALMIRWAPMSWSVVGNLGLRWANVAGAPLASADRRDLGEGSYTGAAFNGQIVAGVYALTFNAAGTVCYVTAEDGDRNPWHNPSTGVAIVADGSTPHDLVVPGLRLVFAAGVTDSDSAVVALGAYLDAVAFATRALNAGATKNDGEVHAFRAAVVNYGDRPVVNAVLRPCPALYYTGADAETIIARLGPHSSAERDQLATEAALSMTFDTWTDQGSYYTANVKVGGVLAIATAKFDGETVYEFGDGHGYVDAADRLKGLQVVFAKIATDPTGKTVVVQVRGGWQWARLAQDVNGNPATYQCADVALGEIPAGGSVFVWVGVAVPAGQARGGIKLWTPRIRCEEV